MKNRSLFIAFVLLLCFGNTAIAKGNVDFNTAVSSSSSFVFQLSNPEQAAVQVTLRDLDGVTLHQATFNEAGISHQYNLKNLPRGAYVLIVQCEDLIQVQPITISKSGLVIDSGALQTIAPPKIEQNSSFLDVQMTCPPSLSVYLEVEDASGNVLYGRYIQSKGAFQKRFNLKELEDGQYHFSIAIEGAGLDHQYEELIKVAGGQ